MRGESGKDDTRSLRYDSGIISGMKRGYSWKI